MTIEEQIAQFREAYATVLNEIGRVVVGQQSIVEGTLQAIFAGGHVLLEGVPGLGKTLLVRTLGEVLDLSFNRIQFTPDLMPADILGTNLVVESPEGRREFQFQRGVFLDKAGDHRVEFKFQPPLTGFYISVAAIVVALGLLAYVAFVKRRD